MIFKIILKYVFVFTTFCKLYSNRYCGQFLARRFDTILFKLSCVSLVLEGSTTFDCKYPSDLICVELK